MNLGLCFVFIHVYLGQEDLLPTLYLLDTTWMNNATLSTQENQFNWREKFKF